MKNNSPYSEIRSYFVENMQNLPNTLDGETKYYMDVKFTANLWIEQIDNAIKEMKSKGMPIHRSAIAVSGKNNLITLYNDLQDIDAWNQPKQKFERSKR